MGSPSIAQVVSAAGGSKRIGTALGSKVDRQFCAVIKTGQPFSKWLEDKKKKTPQAWNPAWAKLKKELSPVTRAIVQLCVNNKWTPVDAQVNCASLRMRVGTAVDAIVRDEKGRLILLEIKTGGGLSVVKADGQMLHELSAVSNGIYHQYHLQHCVTRMCFEETFPETPVHRAVVVMAGRTGAAGQDVLPRIWGLADRIRARLVENRVTKATARKHSKRAAQLQAIAQAIASTGSCNALAAEARARQARKVVGQLRPKAKAKGGKGGTRARGKGKGGAKAKKK